jgi:hypothetical protein
MLTLGYIIIAIAYAAISVVISGIVKLIRLRQRRMLVEKHNMSLSKYARHY